MTTSTPPILERLSALADGLRSRVLLLLERRELTVSELCEVLQLPQSTVSRHLKTLVDGGWAASRPEGARRLYRMPLEQLDSPARRLWELTREPIAETAAAHQDALRLEAVLARRRVRSREFFDSAAGRWDRLRDDLFGDRFYLFALSGLLDPDWVAADLGCGTGPVVEALAPVVGRVIGIDGSRAMVEAARDRLRDAPNVEIRRGELEALPLADASVDAVTLFLVLHHVAEPDRVLREVTRVLRAGGRAVLVDMLPHDRAEYRQEMGHVWTGFAEEQIESMMLANGLGRIRTRALPPEPESQGPALFAATGTALGRAA